MKHLTTAMRILAIVTLAALSVTLCSGAGFCARSAETRSAGPGSQPCCPRHQHCPDSDSQWPGPLCASGEVAEITTIEKSAGRSAESAPLLHAILVTPVAGGRLEVNIYETRPTEALAAHSRSENARVLRC